MKGKKDADKYLKQHPTQGLKKPKGSLYYHTLPTPIERPKTWHGPYWPQMESLDVVPDATDNSWISGPGVSLPPPDWLGAYQNFRPLAPEKNKTRKAWIVGSGLAGLSVAFYLIRDAGFAPENITILEVGKSVGGSLDGAGNAKEGYITRGGREMT